MLQALDDIDLLADVSLAPDIEPEIFSGRQTNGDSEKFVKFNVLGRECCVHAAAVDEIIYCPNTTRIPNNPEWLAGISSFKGEPVAVIKPSRILGFADRFDNHRKLIVFQTMAKETRFALPVDNVKDLIDLSVQEIADRKHANEDTFVSDIKYDGLPITLIDHQRLFHRLNHPTS